MQTGSLNITAPALNAPPHNEAEAFGSVVWLWMHADDHRDVPLRALSALVLPPLKNQQYILASAQHGQDIRPVAYVAWANLSAEAEARYIDNPAHGLQPEDWASGDRMWFTDWIVPFGHTREFRHVLGKLLAANVARALHHRGNERGMRVNHWRGDQISLEQSHTWWATRPMLAVNRNIDVKASS